MERNPGVAAAVRTVSEVPRSLLPTREGAPARACSLVAWVHPEWEDRFPWLVQGTTGRCPEGGSGDFALFREGGPPASEEAWAWLREGLGFSGVAHARQVHGREVRFHGAPVTGLSLTDPADGHCTPLPGTLLAVTVADCVPVFLVDPTTRSVALLHAGWRGVAGGILREGVARMKGEFGARAEDLFLHLGPAICGECYEVGPEVHRALGVSVPPSPAPVDLRAFLVRQAMEMALGPGRVTRSAHCTRCTGSPFFSHRGGDLERQVGFLGIRPDAS